MKMVNGVRQYLIKRFVAVSLLLLYPVVSAQAYQSFPFHLSAQSAVLMDAETSKVIMARSPHVKRPPASTTKLLTALVVLDHLSLDKALTASVYAAGMPRTNISLRHGEKFYVRDLLRALLIASANDAAVVLAEGAAGSERRFASLMNKKARRLGAKNSYFVNPHGLPNGGQHSTAYDLALIVKAASQKPFLQDAMRTKFATIRSLRGRAVRLKNHNRMLWRDHRPLYGKTGWTRKSRHCFAGNIHYRGKNLYLVTMAGSKPWHDLRKMLDYAYGYVPKDRIKRNQAILSKSYVVKMQEVLKKRGFDPGSADGIIGPKTLNAIMAFQKAHGLKPDGIVGRLTQKELETEM